LPPFFFAFFFAAIPPHPHSAPEELLLVNMNLLAQLHQHKKTKTKKFFGGDFLEAEKNSRDDFPREFFRHVGGIRY
jgi:hypothetical protein